MLEVLVTWAAAQEQTAVASRSAAAWHAAASVPSHAGVCVCVRKHHMLHYIF